MFLFRLTPFSSWYIPEHHLTSSSEAQVYRKIDSLRSLKDSQKIQAEIRQAPYITWEVWQNSPHKDVGFPYDL